MKFLSFMFTLAICTILNGSTQVNIKILLIQSYHTTCVMMRIGIRISSPRRFWYTPTTYDFMEDLLIT